MKKHRTRAVKQSLYKVEPVDETEMFKSVSGKRKTLCAVIRDIYHMSGPNNNTKYLARIAITMARKMNARLAKQKDIISKLTGEE